MAKNCLNCTFIDECWGQGLTYCERDKEQLNVDDKNITVYGKVTFKGEMPKKSRRED